MGLNHGSYQPEKDVEVRQRPVEGEKKYTRVIWLELITGQKLNILGLKISMHSVVLMKDKRFTLRSVTSVMVFCLLASTALTALPLVGSEVYEVSEKIHPSETISMDISYPDQVTTNRTVEDNELTNNDPPTNIRTPAEWERLKEVLVRWGDAGSDYYTMEVVREVAEVTTAQIVTTGDTGSIYDYLEGYGVNMDNVSFAEIHTDTGWIRDYGPISITDRTTGEMSFVNMRYRRHNQRPNDDAFPQNYASLKGVDNYDTTDGNNWLSNDGGNFIVDGAGFFYGTDAIFDYNDELTDAEVEQWKKEYFDLERFETVPRMPNEGTGHIDMAIKMLNETTVLVSELVDEDENDGDYQALESAADLFEGLTARNGQPYEVVRIPMEREGGWSTTYYTYSNSLITNGLVLVPIYGRTYDDDAISIYEEAMPDHEIIGIDSSGVIQSGGAIHCTTMQIAESNAPPTIDIEDVSEDSEGITVSADIQTDTGLSFSHLYYNTSIDDTIERLDMEPVDENTYESVLPLYPPETEIRYFIQVEDDHRALNYSGDIWNMYTYEVMGGESPEVSLTSPEGGEVWEARTEEDITWEATEGDDPIENVTLYYSEDGGDTWRIIAADIEDTGNYVWQVPNENSAESHVRVEVVDGFGRSGENISDAFTIEGVPPEPPKNIEVEYVGAEVVTLFQDNVSEDKGYTTGEDSDTGEGSGWEILQNGATVGDNSWDFGDGEYFKTDDFGYRSWLISPEITIPEGAENVELSFDHWRSFAAQQTFLDGGNLKLSTTGVEGDYELIIPNEGYDGENQRRLWKSTRRGTRLERRSRLGDRHVQPDGSRRRKHPSPMGRRYRRV